jgi:predicted transcriptional regulator
MGRPYNIYYFESIKNLSDSELNVYIFFIDMYLFYGCKPLNLSVEQIYTAIKSSKNTVQKALNGLYKKGFYKVFKNDLYNKNCYIRFSSRFCGG